MTARGLPAFGQQQPPVDPARLARQIIAGGNFHLHARTQSIPLWLRVMNWIGSWLNRIFGHISGPSAGAMQIIGFIAIAIVAGVVLAGIVLLLLSISNDASKRSSGAEARALRTRVAAKVWYDRAVAAAQNGQFRSAAVLLFRAAVTILDLRGFVHDQPSRTVEECAGELQARAPQYLSDFRSVARAFTAALYAEAPIDASDWERARAAYDHLFGAVTNAS